MGKSATAKRPDAFSTTHWSVVLAAGTSETSEARDALSTLCEKYWQPLYVYVRYRGYSGFL